MSLPIVPIAGVAANQGSAKIQITPYALPAGGYAADYAVLVFEDPGVVKFAGLWHLDADQAGGYSSVHFEVDGAGRFVQPVKVVANASPGYDPRHHADVPATEIEVNGLT